MRYQFAFSLGSPSKTISLCSGKGSGQEHTSYSGKDMHSVTTLSIDFDSTCSNRFGNELNVESVPLNLDEFSHSARELGTGRERATHP
jgi:hypothetical protein